MSRNALVKSSLLSSRGFVETPLSGSLQRTLNCCAVSSFLYTGKSQTEKSKSCGHIYWCNLCHFTTKKTDFILNHVISCHRFMCHWCSFESFSRSSVLVHMTRLHSERMRDISTKYLCRLVEDDDDQNNSKKNDTSKHLQNRTAQMTKHGKILSRDGQQFGISEHNFSAPATTNNRDVCTKSDSETMHMDKSCLPITNDNEPEFVKPPPIKMFSSVGEVVDVQISQDQSQKLQKKLIQQEAKQSPFVFSKRSKEGIRNILKNSVNERKCADQQLESYVSENIQSSNSSKTFAKASKENVVTSQLSMHRFNPLYRGPPSISCPEQTKSGIEINAVETSQSLPQSKKDHKCGKLQEMAKHERTRSLPDKSERRRHDTSSEGTVMCQSKTKNGNSEPDLSSIKQKITPRESPSRTASKKISAGKASCGNTLRQKVKRKLLDKLSKSQGAHEVSVHKNNSGPPAKKTKLVSEMGKRSQQERSQDQTVSDYGGYILPSGKTNHAENKRTDKHDQSKRITYYNDIRNSDQSKLKCLLTPHSPKSVVDSTRSVHSTASSNSHNFPKAVKQHHGSSIPEARTCQTKPSHRPSKAQDHFFPSNQRQEMPETLESAAEDTGGADASNTNKANLQEFLCSSDKLSNSMAILNDQCRSFFDDLRPHNDIEQTEASRWGEQVPVETVFNKSEAVAKGQHHFRKACSSFEQKQLNLKNIVQKLVDKCHGSNAIQKTFDHYTFGNFL